MSETIVEALRARWAEPVQIGSLERHAEPDVKWLLGLVTRLTQERDALHQEVAEFKSNSHYQAGYEAGTDDARAWAKQHLGDMAKDLDEVRNAVLSELMALANRERVTTPWCPLDDVPGQMSQISNIVAGICQERDALLEDAKASQVAHANGNQLLDRAQAALAKAHQEIAALVHIAVNREHYRAECSICERGWSITERTLSVE